MPQAETQQFGSIPYEASEAIEFPNGLPAFESERAFLLIERAETRPVVFLQSLQNKSLCFVTLPVATVDPGYELAISEEDGIMLGLDSEGSGTGRNLSCLAVLSVTESRPTANLLAPVVVNRAANVGVQAIRMDNRYSHQHPLGAICS